MQIKLSRSDLFVSLVFIGAILFASDVAHAKQAPKKSRFRDQVQTDSKNHNIVREDGKLVLYKKRNVVDFDDSLIEGEVRNPSEFYFVHRPEEKFNSLVQRRKNFQKEMLRDTVMIR